MRDIVSDLLRTYEEDFIDGLALGIAHCTESGPSKPADGSAWEVSGDLSR